MGPQSDSSKRSIDRRTFLKDTTSFVSAGGLASVFTEEGLALPVGPVEADSSSVFGFGSERSEALFPQSVASGGPTPEGVLLWTRIAPERYRGGPVAVEVSRDPSFSEPVYRGIVESTEITAAHDHTVTVDLDGLLAPDSEYAYRFIYDGTASQTGRCQTLPRPGSAPDRIRFAVATCQDYQNGYFGAYSHIAEEDVDFLVHLGDFIYESAGEQYTAPWADSYAGRGLELPSGHDVAHTLADYRYLYNTYRSDPHLQRALEQHTLLPVWDDHEVADNRYWEYDTDSPRLPSHPKGDDPDAATRITAAAVQAWVEQLPARIEYEPGSGDDLHEQFLLQRQFQFGDLTTLVFTDERLFRDPPPSYGSEPATERTMLGADQREWFLDAIATAETTWTVWANEVLTMPLRIGPSEIGYYLNKDAWDGYREERETIMREVAQADSRNFITLTGDFHTAMAGYQQTGYGFFGDNQRVGVEFMAPAVTSVNLAEVVPGSDELSRFDITELVVTTTNPHVEFFDSTVWGYSVVEFTPEGCTYTAYSVDKRVADPAEKRRLTTLRVPEGSVDIRTVE